jgi:FAD/FMN-containing dehydrogenase
MTTLDERDASISRPGDSEYELATRVFNLAAPVTPAVAVTARTVDQVRAAIRLAKSAGRPVRMLTTGHASGSARQMDNAVLVRTELSGEVEVDTTRRVARIPAGTLWTDVVAATSPHGLAAPHGSAPTVGVVGYLLRGGISFYGRKVGLAVNSVRAIDLVTADGELRHVDAVSDPDLFWALRGGGGGFGVVTAVEVDLFPASTVVTGAAFWPAALGARVLSVWERWALTAPAEVATSLRVLNLPPLDDIPPVLSSGPMLCVDGVVLGTTGDDATLAQQQAEELLSPLRSIAEPVMDTWHTTTPSAVLATHMDPSEPVPAQGDSMLLTELGDDGAAEFLRVLGEGSNSPLVLAGLRQLGGAMAVPDPDGGALNHLDAHYIYSGAGIPLDTDSATAISSHFSHVRAALAPWDTGRTAPTFVESVGQPQGHLSPEQVHAVDRVRARVDPTGLFRDDITPNATAIP